MDEFGLADKYLEEGKGELAMPILEKLAAGGMRAAMHAIGHTYLYGVGGIPQNYDLAFEWFSRAAQNGCPQGMYHSGVCNAEGFGTPVNPALAVEWFKKSAERGDEDAMYRVGDCYERGFGVKKDMGEAAEWYRKAAHFGQEDAAQKLTDLDE